MWPCDKSFNIRQGHMWPQNRRPLFVTVRWNRFFAIFKHETIPLRVSKKHRRLYAKSYRFAPPPPFPCHFTIPLSSLSSVSRLRLCAERCRYNPQQPLLDLKKILGMSITLKGHCKTTFVKGTVPWDFYTFLLQVTCDVPWNDSLSLCSVRTSGRWWTRSGIQSQTP